MHRSNKKGFTLIELLVVIAIIGILAAIAVPAFIGYVRKSKSSEVGPNLKLMYTGANTYYSSERATQGITMTNSTNCVTTATTRTPATPTRTKQTAAFTQSGFIDLGFDVTDPVYYGYLNAANAPGTCAQTSAAPLSLYTFRAQGDLDGDGTFSTFEMNAGVVNGANFTRSAGIFIQNETE